MLTKPTPERCDRCRGLLFPPHLAPDLDILGEVDFVCTNCGRAYLWRGSPPILSVVYRSHYDADEQDQSCQPRLALGSRDPSDGPRPPEWTPLEQKHKKNTRFVWHSP
jgi:hypothetical protein